MTDNITQKEREFLNEISLLSHKYFQLNEQFFYNVVKPAAKNAKRLLRTFFISSFLALMVAILIFIFAVFALGYPLIISCRFSLYAFIALSSLAVFSSAIPFCFKIRNPYKKNLKSIENQILKATYTFSQENEKS